MSTYYYHVDRRIVSEKFSVLQEQLEYTKEVIRRRTDNTMTKRKGTKITNKQIIKNK